MPKDPEDLRKSFQVPGSGPSRFDLFLARISDQWEGTRWDFLAFVLLAMYGAVSLLGDVSSWLLKFFT